IYPSQTTENKKRNMTRLINDGTKTPKDGQYWQSEDGSHVDSQRRPTGRIYATPFGIAIRPSPAQSPSPSASVTPETPIQTVTKKHLYTVIRAKLLIPGASDPIPDAALVIQDTTIAWVGTQSDLPEKYATAPHRAVTVPYLMPGLWEVHAHFIAESPS